MLHFLAPLQQVCDDLQRDSAEFVAYFRWEPVGL
jgi:hypothetical protein